MPIHTLGKSGQADRALGARVIDMTERARETWLWKVRSRKHRKTLAEKREVMSVENYVDTIGQGADHDHACKMLYRAPPTKIGIDEVVDFEQASKVSRSHIESYPHYVASLGNVKVFGGSSLIFGAGDAVLNDTLADPHIGRYVDMRDDDFVLGQSGNTLTVFAPRPRRMVDRAFLMSGLFAVHFGHWFAEYLPRLRHLENLEGSEAIPLLVKQRMPRSHFEMLRYFCDNPLIPIRHRECIVVRHLLTAPTINAMAPNYFPGTEIPFSHQSAWSAEAMQFMRRKILGHFPQNVDQTRAIYLSRKNSKNGLVANESEVEACLADLGVEIVHMENHPFAEQVNILRSSHTVIGATGSALNLLMLAQKPTRMLIFAQAESHNWGGWLGPMRDIGFDPRFLMMEHGSRTEKHMPVIVDLGRLREMMRGTEKDAAEHD